jgi:hypothetical protein
MTRRPLIPIKEKSIYSLPVRYTWWEQLNSNGDASNIIVQFTLAPFVFPYIIFRKIFHA